MTAKTPGHQPVVEPGDDPDDMYCISPGCPRPDCQLYRSGWEDCLADLTDALDAALRETLRRISRGES